MLRWSLLMLLAAGSLAAEIRWTCDAKDGKFIMQPCATCKKFYCWDGKIFSDDPDYARPPAYVLAYWEEVKRKSQHIRADIERKSKEMQEHAQKAAQETQQLNQQRTQADKEFMDNLNRRIAESRSSSASPHSGMPVTTRHAVPKDIILVPPEPAASAPTVAPSSRAKVSELQIGMNRAAVEEILGKQHSAISIPEDDGLVEVLSYTLDDHGTARVRIEKGKVASVKISE
jgi:hypothetical protein